MWGLQQVIGELSLQQGQRDLKGSFNLTVSQRMIMVLIHLMCSLHHQVITILPKIEQHSPKPEQIDREVVINFILEM